MSKGLEELRSPAILRFPENDGVESVYGVEYVYTEKQINIISSELQAFELIKRLFEIDEEDFYFDEETGKYFFIGYEIKKEEYDFLKGVLL